MDNLVTRTVVLDDLTPAEAAKIIAHWGSGEQAAFFDALWEEGKDWPGTGWCMQACHIADEIGITGRKFVNTLAGHVAALPEPDVARLSQPPEHG